MCTSLGLNYITLSVSPLLTAIADWPLRWLLPASSLQAGHVELRHFLEIQFQLKADCLLVPPCQVPYIDSSTHLVPLKVGVLLPAGVAGVVIELNWLPLPL